MNIYLSILITLLNDAIPLTKSRASGLKLGGEGEV